MGYTRGQAWNEPLIKEKVMEVVAAFELDRMPSRKEVETYFGNSSLTNAISRHCGWYHLAEELGLTIKKSETYFGKSQEEAVGQYLVSIGLEVKKMPQNFPYDLLVEDCVKVDVKAAREHKGEYGSFYSFNLEKPYCTCDVYVLRMMEDEMKTVRTLVVPSKFVSSNSQISVGGKQSKYYRFTDRWDYIEDCCKFFTSIS